jgi:hypothetical protein
MTRRTDKSLEQMNAISNHFKDKTQTRKLTSRLVPLTICGKNIFNFSKNAASLSGKLSMPSNTLRRYPKLYAMWDVTK